MKEKKRIFNILTFGQIILDVVIIIISLYLAYNSKLSLSIISKVFGIILVICGLYSLLKYLVILNKNKIIFQEIVYGIIGLALGVFIIINPLSLASILSLGIGIWLIISSIFKGTLAYTLKKYDIDTWKLQIAFSIISFILGGIIIFNPFKTYFVISSFISILAICYFSIDILQQIIFRNRIKNLVKIFFE